MKLTDLQKTVLGVIQQAPDTELTEEQLQAAKELSDMGLATVRPPTARPSGRGYWPIWAVEHFPAAGQEHEELDTWKPMTQRYALHRCVLVVMTTRLEGAWKAYCAPVAGMNHELEIQPVLDHGCDVGERVALALFPHMKGIPYAP